MRRLILSKVLPKSGDIFGELLLLGEEKVRDKGGNILWKCKCNCGEEKSIRISRILKGGAKSCGCLTRLSVTTHGKSGHRLYSVWKAMVDRCHNKNSTRYKNYGARGIYVCSTWKQSIDCFLEDMWDSYKEGLELDRIDNDAGYFKENCRWVTHAQNLRNKGKASLKGRGKYKGVMCVSKGKYRVRLKGKEIGKFTDEKEAAIAYNKAALLEFGEYAYLNKIEDY